MAADPMIAVRLRVSGRVQGVWYRASTAREAERQGVRGWVRNLPDGSVEAWRAGAPPARGPRVARGPEGPPHARVDALDAEPHEPEGFSDFAIRR